MPTVTAEQFKKLSLMAGTARSLETEALTQEDIEIWERDFAILCDDLTKLVDPELGSDLRGEKGFYDEAIKVAKAYFDKIPFGGLKAATGQFGFRLIGSQDLKAATSALTPQFYSWIQTLTTTASHTYKQGAFGTAATTNVYTSNRANESELLAFHRLISYKPSPRLLYVEWNINSYPYIPYCVEPYSKISKNDKLFKIIPMPGRVIIHPGGGFYTHFYFDPETGTSAPPAAGVTVDVEIALFGLVFAEYDYLKAGAAILY